MSEGIELTEAEALAAEHALGILSGAERAEAEARMVRDPAFAADVDAWRARLAPLMDAVPPVQPPESVWRGVERLLPANDNGEAARGLRFWRGASAGGFSLAAASLAAVFFLYANPREVRVPVPTPVAPQGQILSASLAQPQGRAQPLFVASYDPDRKALIITSLLPPGADSDKVHELWLIAGQDKPKSLGLVEAGRTKVVALPTQILDKMAEGNALAISEEPPGGSPSPDGPTGPVISVGKLARL
jgi:anti-sigma-K factor RskA